MYGSYHHISVMGKENAPCDHKYDVTGGLCENNDKFAVDRMLPEINIGDLLFIHDAGAHGFSMGYNYNGKLRSAELLLQEDGTVTVCHSKTVDLGNITREADILVSAAGVADLITADMVKEGAVVIDVAMNRDENGKLCGDVDFAAVQPQASYITPVPGGVGPMTICSLMRNTLMAGKKELYSL